LRLKGIVWLQDKDTPIVIQGVHHVLHPPVPLARSAQPNATRIVLITRGLSAAGLRASFAAAIA
jgi:G3E family GTPase